jgi:putative membrane protein
VHENIYNNEIKFKCINSFKIIHFGYVDNSTVKANRNLDLLVKDYLNLKKDSFYWYYYLKNSINLCRDVDISEIKQLKNEMHNNFHPTFDEFSNEILVEFNINKKNKVSNEILVAITKDIEDNFATSARIEKGDLMQHINRFYDIQGKAERIKHTPFLKIYSAFTKLIVSFYVVLIPLFIGDIDLGGEESGFEFLAVPIMVVISTAFLTINKLANLYGEPFSENKTSVSIDEICKTLEMNCVEVRDKL